MAYDASTKRAIGAVRATLAGLGITRQSAEFRAHGHHEPAADAPLLLVACSGGRDSMALASVAHTVTGMLGVRCGAVIIDHGMQAGSTRVALDTAARCRALGLDPVIARPVAIPGAPGADLDAYRAAGIAIDADAAPTAGHAGHDGTCADGTRANRTRKPRGEGAEAAARDARYREIGRIARAEHSAAVLLAHTLDDQAETMMIGLIRGSGPGAAAGMPATISRGGVTYARPLLGLTRADTTAICRAAGIAWWDDPTNGDAYAGGEIPADLPLRSQLRHAVMPALARIGGDATIAHMAKAADAIRDDNAYLDAEAARIAREQRIVIPAMTPAASPANPAQDAPQPGKSSKNRVVVRIDADALAAQPRPIRTRIIARTLTGLGVDGVTARHIERIEALAVDWHGQGSVRLPQGFSAFLKNHVIEVCQDNIHANR